MSTSTTPLSHEELTTLVKLTLRYYLSGQGMAQIAGRWRERQDEGWKRAMHFLPRRWSHELGCAANVFPPWDGRSRSLWSWEVWDQRGRAKTKEDAMTVCDDALRAKEVILLDEFLLNEGPVPFRE